MTEDGWVTECPKDCGVTIATSSSHAIMLEMLERHLKVCRNKDEPA